MQKDGRLREWSPWAGGYNGAERIQELRAGEMVNHAEKAEITHSLIILRSARSFSPVAGLF